MDLFHLSLVDGERFVLTVLRLSGLMAFAPFFASVTFPLRLRALFTLVLAWCLFAVLPQVPAEALPHTTGELVAMGALELGVGCTIGFAVRLGFNAFIMAGQLIGTNLGFSLANVVDPFSEDSSSILGEMFFMLAVVLFLEMNGHHWILRLMVRSFTSVPAGAFAVSPDMVMVIGKLFGDLFRFGIDFSGPVTVILFFVMVSLGFMARATPQLNVFSVGFAAQIIIGLAVVYLFVPHMERSIQDIFLSVTHDVHRLCNAMAVAATG